MQQQRGSEDDEEGKSSSSSSQTGGAPSSSSSSNVVRVEGQWGERLSKVLQDKRGKEEGGEGVAGQEAMAGAAGATVVAAGGGAVVGSNEGLPSPPQPPDMLGTEGEAGGAAVEAAGEGEKGGKNPFTHFYAQLSHQQNMLQDDVRTGGYRNAIHSNKEDFKDKVVLDVGTGSGILAFFAAQAGARKVYAVEASDAADTARELVKANGMEDTIEVVKGKLEDVSLPEKVDVIISEPIGFLLVHERMLETYIKARDLFLKPGGLMYPSVGTIMCAPVTAEALYNEQYAKAAFWNTRSLYDIDVSSQYARALEEHFSQALVGAFYPQTMLCAEPVKHRVDFRTVTEEELLSFTIPLRFEMDTTAVMHGLGCWFVLDFHGSTTSTVLDTGPHQATTHWYQCRLLMENPVAVNRGQVVTGSMAFAANDNFSYDVNMEVHLQGSDISSEQRIMLQTQVYQYLAQQGGNGGNDWA